MGRIGKPYKEKLLEEVTALHYQHCYTGSYTGAGGGTQKTISLPFTPKHIEILDPTGNDIWIKNNQISGKYAFLSENGTDYDYAIEIDTSLMKVGGNGSNYCNYAARTYYYTIWG